MGQPGAAGWPGGLMRHGVRDDECIFLAGSFLDMCPCMEQITSKSVTCANFYERVVKKIT